MSLKKISENIWLTKENINKVMMLNIVEWDGEKDEDKYFQVVLNFPDPIDCDSSQSNRFCIMPGPDFLDVELAKELMTQIADRINDLSHKTRLVSIDDRFWYDPEMLRITGAHVQVYCGNYPKRSEKFLVKLLAHNIRGEFINNAWASIRSDLSYEDSRKLCDLVSTKINDVQKDKDA